MLQLFEVFAMGVCFGVVGTEMVEIVQQEEEEVEWWQALKEAVYFQKIATTGIFVLLFCLAIDRATRT